VYGNNVRRIMDKIRVKRRTHPALAEYRNAEIINIYPDNVQNLKLFVVYKNGGKCVISYVQIEAKQDSVFERL
jgi:hypothetical protein